MRRATVYRVAAGLFVAAVFGFGVWTPGVCFRERAAAVHPGMTADEVVATMGCPPGSYGLSMGEPYYRSVSAFDPPADYWYGEDGFLMVVTDYRTGLVARVNWCQCRPRPRTNAEIAWEEVRGYAAAVRKRMWSADR